MVDYSQAGVDQIEQINRTFAQQCLDRMGKPFLAGLGTASAAKDMDAVREALGEKQINYLGFQLRHRLGTAYVSRFPNRVRTMVLDGAIDPSADPMASLVDQMAGFQVALMTTRPTAPRRRPARWAPTRRSSSSATTNWWTRWSTVPDPPPIRGA